MRFCVSSLRQGEALKRGFELLEKRIAFILNEFKLGNEATWIPYEIAAINAIMGNKSKALRLLQEAVDAGWRNHRFGSIDPLLENLHDDQRFKIMMTQVKAMVYREREKVDRMDWKGIDR